MKKLGILRYILPILILAFGVAFYLNASVSFDANTIWGVGTTAAGVEIDNSGNITLTGNIVAGGTSAIVGNETVGGTLIVTGKTTLSADTTVTGYVKSGGFIGGLKVKGATYTITVSDFEDYAVILSTDTDGFTFTLAVSTMVTAGAYTVIKTSAAVVMTITCGNATDKIDGSTSDHTSCDAAGDFIKLFNDSARNTWQIVGEAID